MKQKTYAPTLPTVPRPDTPGLDIVVPFTTRPLTRAALSAAGRFSAELLPLIRMVRIQVVPFPLQLETAPVSAAVLHRQYALMAMRYGAQVEICYARDEREALLRVISRDSVVLIAARKRRWWWKSQEQRMAEWLRGLGYKVVLELVEKNNA